MNAKQPTPNQQSKNRLDEFKYKRGDRVRLAKSSDLKTGTIIQPFFCHEDPDAQFGGFDWFNNQNPLITYEDFLRVMRDEGVDPFARMYYVGWDQEQFTGVEYEGAIVLLE